MPVAFGPPSRPQGLFLGLLVFISFIYFSSWSWMFCMVLCSYWAHVSCLHIVSSVMSLCSTVMWTLVLCKGRGVDRGGGLSINWVPRVLRIPENSSSGVDLKGRSPSWTIIVVVYYQNWLFFPSLPGKYLKHSPSLPGSINSSHLLNHSLVGSQPSKLEPHSNTSRALILTNLGRRVDWIIPQEALPRRTKSASGWVWAPPYF